MAHYMINHTQGAVTIQTLFMEPIKTTVQPNPFTLDAIDQQMDRIFLDSHFTESEILKKFLCFVVHETIAGRANCLKEYTIATNVLGKPSNFNPQENGIVRIHAGRLRRALSDYYHGKGADDPIVIDIPKGKYVAVFFDPSQQNVSPYHPGYVESAISSEAEISAFAIMPFICSRTGGPVQSFADGLCLQLCSSLASLHNMNVTAYHAVKSLASNDCDLKHLGATMGFSHVVTGGVQYSNDKIRVNVHIIECSSYKQIYSETYERRISSTNAFDIQDEICMQTIKKIEELRSKRRNIPMLSAI